MSAVLKPIPPESTTDRLLTLADVARYLGVSQRTVRRLMLRGLPYVKFGRVVRFLPADVFRFVAARKG